MKQRRCFTLPTPMFYQNNAVLFVSLRRDRFSSPCATLVFRFPAPNSLFARDLSHLSHYLSHGNAVNVSQLRRSVTD